MSELVPEENEEVNGDIKEAISLIAAQEKIIQLTNEIQRLLLVNKSYEIENEKIRRSMSVILERQFKGNAGAAVNKLIELYTAAKSEIEEIKKAERYQAEAEAVAEAVDECKGESEDPIELKARNCSNCSAKTEHENTIWCSHDRTDIHHSCSGWEPTPVRTKRKNCGTCGDSRCTHDRYDVKHVCNQWEEKT